MICLDMHERLSAYLDGDLSTEEMKEVAEHLKNCEACQSVLAEIRQVRDELRALPEVEIPVDLHSSIMRDLKSHLKSKKRTFFNLDFKSWGYRQWVPVTAAMMVLVMFLSAGGVLWYSGRLTGGDGLLGVKAEEDLNEQSYLRSGPVSMTGVSPEAPPEASKKGLTADRSTTMMAAAPNDQYYGGEGTGSGAAPLLDTARKIIHRAQLVLEVTRGNVKSSSVEAVRVVQSNFGYVETSSTTESDSERKEITSFFMVARVPAANLDNAVRDLTALGRTTREDTSAQDITDVYVDLDARLRNKENQESRLLQIMSQAKTVGELLQVEGELSRVRGDIESMRAQINSYDKAVDLSTITLTISEEGATGPVSPSPWSEVWRVFVEAWRQLLLFAAKAAPAAIVIAVLAGGAVWITKRRQA